MFKSLDDAHTHNAIEIIKNDHSKVKKLFEDFEKATDKRLKKKIADEAIMELKIHAEIEENIFYPSVRKNVEEDLMNEADEEHHVAKLLIAELDQMDGSESHWEAKFTVLAENIKHHIREEEGEMLPQARKINADFDAIGQKLLRMKKVLLENGVPTSDEERLMKGKVKAADSPAKAAKKKSAKILSHKNKPIKKMRVAKKAKGQRSRKVS